MIFNNLNFGLLLNRPYSPQFYDFLMIYDRTEAMKRKEMIRWKVEATLLLWITVIHFFLISTGRVQKTHWDVNL
jgi:hypothetical protein